MSIKADNTKSLTAAGTDTYTATNNFTSYNSGDSIQVIFTNANTGAATLNLNGLGAKAIQKNGSTALASGDILADQPYWLLYDGTDYQLTGSLGGSGSSAWEPNDIPLGSLLASGASLFLNGGAGVYLSMSGTADDAFVLNSPLDNAGVLYDGSNLAIKLHCRLSSSGGVGDTVGLLLDYAVVKAGDNSTTTVTNVAQVDTDVSSEVADINFSLQMSTMTGVASGETLMITVTRNSTGAGADSFGGNFEVISLELIKI